VLACLSQNSCLRKSEKYFAVLNGEPGRRIKFNFGEPEREAIVEALTNDKDVGLATESATATCYHMPD
jgi:hypothetical protein